jgi:hypothetical protein
MTKPRKKIQPKVTGPSYELHCDAWENLVKSSKRNGERMVILKNSDGSVHQEEVRFSIPMRLNPITGLSHNYGPALQPYSHPAQSGDHRLTYTGNIHALQGDSKEPKDLEPRGDIRTKK